ncbi:MAG: hypothetical protein WBA41_08445 [Rivularia sp. (in: cyanobacteria)]
MPRKTQRFRRLDALYRELKGAVPAGNTKLAGYEAFLKGEKKIKVEKKLTAAQRKRYAFAIYPFNLSLATTPEATDRYAAPITAYSNTGRTANGVNLSDNELGYFNVDSLTKQTGDFYPALLRIFVKTSATATSTKATSSITGESYDKFAGNSYSIPFGRSITSADTGATPQTVGEEERRKTLIADLRAVATVGSISYEPELFRSSTGILFSPPS